MNYLFYFVIRGYLVILILGGFLEKCDLLKLFLKIINKNIDFYKSNKVVSIVN